MDSAEVVMYIVQRNRIGVVLYLFAEPIGQAGKPSHGHTHGQILSLNVACGDVRRIGIADNLFMSEPMHFAGL